MFPNYGESEEESLEEISWDDWFEEFDKRNLALIVQEETASGKKSNFNKLVGRENVEEGQSRNGGNGQSRRRKQPTSVRSVARKQPSAKSASTRKSAKSSGGRGTSNKTTSRANASQKSARSSSRSSAGRSAKKSSAKKSSAKKNVKRTNPTTSRSGSGRKEPSRSTSRGRSSRSA
jgi:cobalamin biosynthesis Mg chelatase CobN